MVSSNIVNPGTPIYYGGLTEAEILPYFQSQYPGNAEGCGPFSIAMAANLCNRYHQASNYLGAQVQTTLEQQGLKIRGYGMLGKLDLCLRTIQYRRRIMAPVSSLNTITLWVTSKPTKTIPSRWSTTSPGL